MELLEGKMMEASDSAIISTRLQRIAEQAKKAPTMVLTTLAHHIDMTLLREAFRRTRRDGAPGVDGQSAAEYAEGLEENLHILLERFKSGTYRAPPVRRVHIPKEDGTTRPLGVPTFEDKVLQRAVTMVLEAVYEEEFLDASHGFRPRRNAHQALHRLREGIMDMRGGWVLDVDVSKFFDTLKHEHLRSFLDLRIRDGVIRRAIGKWLNAGVLEAGQMSFPDDGTPQGGVISPLLANIYLHHVMDKWFQEQVQPRLKGAAQLTRYADDLVIVCAREDDARKVLAVLHKRFNRYGLTLHPEKTRLVNFNRPSLTGSTSHGQPGSFDFLGFTHIWAKSRRGWWVVKRKTASRRLARGVKRIWEWCREHRHDPVKEQHEMLVQKIRGHDAYYGITSNYRSLLSFRLAVTRAWRRALRRRSSQRLTWAWMRALLKRYPLPPPRMLNNP